MKKQSSLLLAKLKFTCIQLGILFKCNTNLTMGDEGSTVHTKRPLSQPTTNTEPDSGLKIKHRKVSTGTDFQYKWSVKNWKKNNKAEHAFHFALIVNSVCHFFKVKDSNKLFKTIF